MKFFGLKDKLDDFRNSYGAGEKLLNGAKILGTVAANTVIAAGKATTYVAKRLPEEMEKMKNK